MANEFSYNQLFFNNYLYYIDNEKNWAKAEYLVENISSNVVLPEIITKTLLLKAKLELSKTSESKELVQYCMNNLDNIVNCGCEELRDFVLCNLYDYAFRILVSDGLYSKIETGETTALFACSVLNKVSSYNIKTYRSHIIQIFNKLKKAKAANTSFTSNYILANYYMVMNPFKNKLTSIIMTIKRKTTEDANSFIFNN